MSGSNRYVVAGTKYNFWVRLDSQSRMTGKNGSTPTAGTGEGAVHLIGLKALPAGVVETDSVDVTGDDGVLAQFDFAPNELPEFVGEYAVDNLEQTAIFQGTKVETLRNLKMGALQPNNPVFVDGAMIIQGSAKSQDPATTGQSEWAGYIVPLTTTQPLGRPDFTERDPGNFRLKFSPQVASKKPYGVTIAEADLGTNGTVFIPFTNPYPITMHHAVGDGTETDFVLDFEPIDVTNTYVYFDNGALQATSAYTITPATKTISFSGAPTNGTKIWILYGFAG